MASTSVRCPKCEAVMKLATMPPEGKKIRCPKCAETFVPADNEVKDNSTAVKAKSERPTPAPLPKKPSPKKDTIAAGLPRRKTILAKNDDTDTDDDARPSRKTRLARDEDAEDDRPRRSKSKRDPDDEDDDRPRGKKKPKPASKMGLFIGLGVGAFALLFMCLGGAGGLWWWLGSNPPQNQIVQVKDPGPVVQPGPVAKPDAPAAKDPAAPVVKKNPAPPVVNDPPQKKGGGPKKGPVQPPPPPPEPQPQAVFIAEPVDLDKDLLAKTNRATALLRVEYGNKNWTGSGFVIKSSGDTAYIVTSLNVIAVPEQAQAPKKGPGGPPRGLFPGGAFGPKKGGPPPAAKPKTKITVILQGGTPDEQTLPADVVAVDDEGDLAAVRIKGARNLPAPLNVNQDAAIGEDQPVYYFGYPAVKGAKGNPALIAGKGSVTRLTRDANNEVTDVELAGEIPPGMNGGPVIDAQGQLVGVALGSVPGKGIGFAIPAGELLQMLKGRLAVGVVAQVRQKGIRAEIVGERWIHDRKSNVRVRDVLTLPIGNQPKGAPPPRNDEFLVVAILADPMLKVSGVSAYYARVDAVPTAAEDKGWGKLPQATPVALKVQEELAIGEFRLPPGAAVDQLYAFQFSYANADKQTVYTQPHLVRLTLPSSTSAVTINITGIPDLPTRRYIEDTAESQLGVKVTVKSKTKDGLVLTADPIPDPNTIQGKIKFGKVTSIQGRTVEVAVGKIDLPVPTPEIIDKALQSLQSPKDKVRENSADLLSRAYVIVPERRAEVAKALEKVAGDKNIWSANAALRALLVWGGPENVTGVIPALDNVFTRQEAFNVLAKFPAEPAAATGMAKMLPDWTARGRASFLLKKMGPTAEKAVIPFATHKDGGAAQEACRILGEIGTAQCVPALTEASNSNDNNTKNAARDALTKVKARK